ncbi:peptide ABC transporter permease [Zhengella mangrovi]|uniref:Peptide ABC transporter permease n=1 Tax=Zhengella mangrovi TaxID=1982044 RepID=A0A2G1QNY8_9HYPH|nr:peptide ABC transporter permease [Zhengella mangrovi]PHP67205.1 peptide ABC transporter permease [Zhengella mangrovi]
MTEETEKEQTFDARNARQGRIVLESRKERFLFVAGLAAIIVVALLLLF